MCGGASYESTTGLCLVAHRDVVGVRGVHHRRAGAAVAGDCGRDAMTLEEAVEWCQQHQATVNFRYLARTYGDEWQGYGGERPPGTTIGDQTAGQADTDLH